MLLLPVLIVSPDLPLGISRYSGAGYRSFHTVRIPSKPIPIGYKVIALCSMEYTMD